MLDVRLIAKTEVTHELFKLLEDNPHDEVWPDDGEILAEFSGRACYQSWSRPNPETAKTQDYITRNILAKGHESVLEHVSVSFYVTGISRSAGYELLRHRHLSRSELSQRYVNMHGVGYVVPPAMDRETHADLNRVVGHADTAYYDIRHDLTELGLSTKQAREAARSVLPNATETRFVTTGNIRAWRHVIRMRGALDADAEIREFAVAIFRILSAEYPSFFADMAIFNPGDGREWVGQISLTPAQIDGNKPIREYTAGEMGLT